ncbi:hypothetical protein [Singulisphaera sp. PoT]|uniref:hypothetical protein n=1 Tax=Singulisphaera sp. PoT TaxID=3411797 RepID=UPI003BF4A1D1
MTPRERLIRRINQRGDINHPETPRPLVTLEEFFEGNDAPGSIGNTRNPEFEPAFFYDTFLRIRDKTEVLDVLVEVIAHKPDQHWPNADTIWVITSASPSEVQYWMGELYGDDILKGWTRHRKRESYEVPPHMKPVGIQWG